MNFFFFYFNTSFLNTAVWAKIPFNIGRKSSQSEFSNYSKNKTLWFSDVPITWIFELVQEGFRELQYTKLLPLL